MPVEIKEILAEVNRRKSKDSKSKYYKPLDPEDSAIVREWYKSRIKIPLDGDDSMIFFNSAGTVIGKGYNRVCIGDFGPYIEFDDTQIALNKIKPKWPGEPKYKVKFIWMVSCDMARTKIYFQKREVDYADYLPGCYYICPTELKTRHMPILYDVWSKI